MKGFHFSLAELKMHCAFNFFCSLTVFHHFPTLAFEKTIIKFHQVFFYSTKYAFTALIVS